jgi:hypothetical protein
VTEPTAQPTTFTSDDPGWPDDLAPQHRRYLGSRGVSPEVASARGYLSVTSKSGGPGDGLRHYGWGKSHPLVNQISSATGDAVMVIPLYHAHGDGDPSTYQARADKARMSPPTPGRKPRPLKFEMPHKVKRGTAPGDLPADVNPLRHNEATSSEWPLILTEGIPKADAILTAAIREGIDIVPVALTGVTMGYEAEHTRLDQAAVERKLADMVTTLASGRARVYLCWDSDWADKRQVRDSLVRTGALLAKAGVEEVIYLALPDPEGDDPEAKTGVDDWLAGGGVLADLLANHRMDPPEIDAAELANVEILPETFHVNEGDLVMWDYMLKRIGDSSKPVPVATVKLGCLAEIVEIVSTKRIVGMQLTQRSDAYRIRVDWLQALPGGASRRRSKVIDVAADEFLGVAKWLARDAETGQIDTPSSGDERIAVNTIRRRSTPVTTIEVQTSGWYLHPDDPGFAGGQPGWRYVHGAGYVSAAGAGQGIDCSASSTSAKDSDIGFATLEAASEGLERWLRDWVLGELPGRLAKESPNFVPETAKDHAAVEQMRNLLVIGAIVAARALVPGRAATAPLFLVGPPASGKTLMAMVWGSTFGAAFGTQPYTSIVQTTQAGMEVQLADARNMVAVVDDFKPSNPRDTDRMVAIVDQIARGAADGARKGRSTRNLEVLEAPELAASVVLTGEELPEQSASNSTIQRLLTVPVTPFSGPTYEMMNRLRSENGSADARLAMGAVAQLVAGWLDESLGGEGKVSIRAAGEVRQSLETHASVMATTIAEQVVAVIPTERSKQAMSDFLLGAALLTRAAQELGVFSAREIITIQDRLADAGRWLLTETARVVTRTSPEQGVLELLRDCLQDEGYLTTADGTYPPDGTAETWGWRIGSGSDRRPGRHKIGVVVVNDGRIAIGLTPSLVARALSPLSERGSFTANRVSQMLRGAEDEDGQTILTDPDFAAGTKRIQVKGVRRPMILVRPEVLEVDVSWVEAGATGGIAEPEPEEVAK